MSSYEKVWPKTFIVKAESETSPSHIFGGKEEDVWVASFADRSEAEAWMQGSSQYGQEVVGIKDSKYGKAGEQGRDLSEGADRGGGGSGGEARESELAGRSRQDSELQLPLPLHGRD